jgi:hypothetical protein
MKRCGADFNAKNTKGAKNTKISYHFVFFVFSVIKTSVPPPLRFLRV